MSADVAKLTGLPLFGLLSQAERDTLNGLFSTVDVRRGERVFRQGDPGGSLYVVRTGRVQIVLEDIDGRPLVVSESGPGSVFGEVSLLDGGPRTADAVAATDAELLTLDRDDLLEFVTKHPPASLALLTVMGQRLRSTNELVRANPSRNANDEERAQWTASSKAADWLAATLGSWAFLIAVVVLTAAGVALFAAGVGGGTAGRDPFLAWLGLVAAVVVVQQSALLMARNQQSRRERLKSDLDHEFEMKTEVEMARLLRRFDALDERLRSQQAGQDLDRAIATPSHLAT